MTNNSNSDGNDLVSKEQEKEFGQLELVQEGDSKSNIAASNPSTEQGSIRNENVIPDRTLKSDGVGEELKEESSVAVATAAIAATAFNGSKDDTNTVDEMEPSHIPRRQSCQLRSSRRVREASTSRSSSLGLRRLPVDILLQPTSDFEALSDGELDESDQDQENDPASRRDATASSSAHHRNSNAQSPGGGPSTNTMAYYWSWRIHDLFLSPKYPLKFQLMVSFGSVNFCTTALVIISCILVSYYVGDSVKKINQKAFENRLVPGIQAKTVRYLAESMEQQFIPFDLVDIIEEAFQDRFQGYPNSIVGEDNSVPFRDIVTGRNIYPIVGDPMFLDWQVPADVTQDNYLEHVTNPLRWEHFLSKQPAVSTKSAVFYYQGSSCDPNATEDSENDLLYWPNCTAANHNITTGGVIHPVPTLGPIYRGSNDLLPLFKAIYEVTPDIQDLGLYFASMGAGASFFFPAYPRTIKDSYYTSVGCDWMATPNPIDPSLGPIGKPVEISRCHKKGESVSSTLYNPLERGWCRDQALNPHKTQVDAISDAFNGQDWLLSVGRAIYDRQTKAFVSCSMIAMSLASVEDKLRSSLVTNHSALSLVLFDVKGTVIKSTASPRSSGNNDQTLPTIDQLGVGLSQASYQELYARVQSALELGFDEQWDSETVKGKLAAIVVGDDDKYLVAVSPMPQVPEKYDPAYQPKLLVVMSTSTDDVFEGVRKLDEAVDSDVKNIIWYCLIVGAVGLGFATFMIILMTRTLTAPLRYINDSADGIVESFGHTRASEDDCAVDDGRSGDLDDDDNGKAVSKMEEAPSKTGDKTATKKSFAGSFCSPKTELNDVLQEFNVLMATFSGSKMAKSEKGRRVEVRNSFSLRAEFKDLYLSRKSPDFTYNQDLVIDSQGNETRSHQGEDYVDDQSNLGLIHLGSNIEQPFKSKSKSEKTDKSENERRKQFSSRLFIWTVALIATPLLLTTILIAAVVMYSMTTGFGASLRDAEAYFVKVNLDALSVHVSLRAEIVGRLTGVRVRDTYLMTRYFGWLLFGGVRQADSYTEMLSAAEPCKFYAAENVLECPYYQEHYACDCAWNETNSPPCQDYPQGSSRQLQKVGVSVESRDASTDGDRLSTSFPKVATSPETTEWWEDLNTVPGSEKGSSAAGHDFLYDRMRVSSAMPLFPVLYNYDRDKVNFLGLYIAFEADGMFLGYYGCGILGSESSSWQSTEDNGASNLRPELCPLGKFGYDPR
jgi:hypothetical protein